MQSYAAGAIFAVDSYSSFFLVRVSHLLYCWLFRHLWYI